MRKLAFVLLLLAPTAFAKTFQDNNLNVSHDCGKDGELVIQGNDSNFIVEGACERIAVMGNHNNVKAASAKVVSVPGDDNAIAVDVVGTIKTSGNKNSVAWGKAMKGDKPSVSNPGTGNTVAHR